MKETNEIPDNDPINQDKFEKLPNLNFNENINNLNNRILEIEEKFENYLKKVKDVNSEICQQMDTKFKNYRKEIEKVSNEIQSEIKKYNNTFKEIRDSSLSKKLEEFLQKNVDLNTSISSKNDEIGELNKEIDKQIITIGNLKKEKKGN